MICFVMLIQSVQLLKDSGGVSAVPWVCIDFVLGVSHTYTAASSDFCSAFRVCWTSPPTCHMRQVMAEKNGGYKLGWGCAGGVVDEKNPLQMKCETKSAATSFSSTPQHPPHPPHPSQMTLLLLSRGDRIGLVTSSVLASECWAQGEREREREALNRLFVGNQIMKRDRKTASNPYGDARNPILDFQDSNTKWYMKKSLSVLSAMSLHKEIFFKAINA